MADVLFADGKENLLKAEIDLVTDTIDVMLVDHGTDTPLPASDTALDDIATAARVAQSSGGLSGKSVTDGVFDATDITLSSVSGASCESIVGYKTGVAESNSWLLWYMDTTGTGLPVTPNGGDITISWDTGANKIFAL